MDFFLTADFAFGFASPTALVGTSLAFLALSLGLLSFAYAARYYVAIATVTLSPAANAKGRNGQTNGDATGGTTSVQGNAGAPLPFVSVHIALYNEKNVVQRLLEASTALAYPNYEVVVIDDSTDETAVIVDRFKIAWQKENPYLKIIHRGRREGFKGGALNFALRVTDPRAEYVVVFDADFVPPPDTILKLVEYFSRNGTNGDPNGNGDHSRYKDGDLAAVQGYQWHTLNRTESWLTMAVSCEFSGNYMVDRTFEEIAGAMKMIAGSVYAIRTDVLRKFGWSHSLTEDWELTLRLYASGYKVLYTPLVQVAAECPSTLGRLFRQRMRWAEGHTFNVKKHFFPMLASPKLTRREKVEFLYFAPYYIQSLLLILGTAFWFTSDLLATHLPFWTELFGWSLVATNLIALPLMSTTGLILERRAKTDYRGVFGQVVLAYALAPYQAYASLKGLVEAREGNWVRTLKTGRVAGFLGGFQPRKVVKKVLPPRKAVGPKLKSVGLGSGLGLAASLGVVAFLSVLLVHAAVTPAVASPPAYYFYNQPALPSYQPFDHTPPAESMMTHLGPPSGVTASVPIGSDEGQGPIFFSDPAPDNLPLPFGASVSAHLWVNATSAEAGLMAGGNATNGVLHVNLYIYDPSDNTFNAVPGAAGPVVFKLLPGVNSYEASWGNIAQNKAIAAGDTLMVTFWSPNSVVPPQLLFNSPGNPSSIDFPIEVPQNLFAATGLGAVVFVAASLLVRRRSGRTGRASGVDEPRAYREIQRLTIAAIAVTFLCLPLLTSLNGVLASAVSSSGLSRVVAEIVPYDSDSVSVLLNAVGLHAGNSPGSVWLYGGFFPVTATISWNCSGWQNFVVLGLTSVIGLKAIRGRGRQLAVLALAAAGMFAVNVLRIAIVVILAFSAGYPTALLFHDYAGTIMCLVWLFGFWAFALKHFAKEPAGVKDNALDRAGLQETSPSGVTKTL